MKPKNRLRPRISMSLPADVMEWLTSESVKKGLSISAFAGMKLKEGLEKQNQGTENPLSKTVFASASAAKNGGRKCRRKDTKNCQVAKVS